MKGPYHEQLRVLLKDAADRKVVTQESLGRAMDGKTQTSVGAYLRDVKGGALDLDEADAALRHIGSSLKEFVAGHRIEPTAPDGLRKAHELFTEDDFSQLVEVLHVAPPLRRHVALRLLLATARELLRGRPSGRSGARSAATGTSKAPKRRR